MRISDKTTIKLLPLESQVLDLILNPKESRELSPEERTVLKEQLKTSTILNRQMTGHGFFTKFLVDKEASILPDKKSFSVGGGQATIAGLQHGAGFVLLIKDGVLSTLEGFSYGDDSWPDPWPNGANESELYDVSEVLPSDTPVAPEIK